MIESDVQANIITCLKTFGWKVIRFNSGVAKSGGRMIKFYRLTWRHWVNESKGLSDLLAIKNGRHVWIEVKKSEKEKQRESQATFQKDIESAGAEYYLVSSGIEILQKLGEIKDV